VCRLSSMPTHHNNRWSQTYTDSTTSILRVVMPYLVLGKVDHRCNADSCHQQLSFSRIQHVSNRDVPNIHFVFASVPNSGSNNVFIFGRIVSSERRRIVSLYMYSAASDGYGRLHSVSASCSRSDRLIMEDE